MLLLCSLFRLKELFQVKNGLTTSVENLRKKSLWLKVIPRAPQYAKVASCAYTALGACDGLNWLMMISKQAITEHRWSGVEPDYITPKTFHLSLIP